MVEGDEGPSGFGRDGSKGREVRPRKFRLPTAAIGGLPPAVRAPQRAPVLEPRVQSAVTTTGRRTAASSVELT